MKRNILLIFCVLLFVFGCSSSQKSTDNTNINNSLPKTPARGLQPPTNQSNNNQKNTNQTNKQLKKSKKSADKLKKQQQKQQDKLIKQSIKEEKKRIKQERDKEKQALLNSFNDNDDNNSVNSNSNTYNQNLTTNTPIDTTLNINDLIGNNTDNSQILQYNEPSDENNSLLDKAKSKIYKNDSNKQSLTTMDKVLLLMDKQNNPQNYDSLQTDNINNLQSTDKKPNFIKKQFNEAFPKHIDREITYEKLYNQDIKTILILYPYNRSDYSPASDMLLIKASKELSAKGYYLYPVISIIEQYKQDSLFSSKYTKTSDLHKFKTNYNADAVMFVTIYRFDNPYWSSSTKASAHYTLVSTTTSDTLFARQIEFNYDTPIPPNQYNNKDLELDNEQIYDLGVMQQMQIYTFQDFPYGPYHKKYKKDRKKFSKQQEVKYKINVRPS